MMTRKTAKKRRPCNQRRRKRRSAQAPDRRQRAYQQEPENPRPKGVYKVQPVADAAESDGLANLSGGRSRLAAGLCGGWLFGG